MPIYEYECSDCSHQFEAMRKIRDAALTECPSCGSHGLQKLISKVAFRLKGTGWYETDFKTKPADTEAEKSEKPGTDEKPAKKESGATDVKTASSTTETTKKPAAKTED